MSNPVIGDLSYGMSVLAGESLRVKADGSVWEHFQPIGMNEIMRIMVDGTQQVGAFAAMKSGTTTSGSFVMYPTSDGTANGTALFTTILGVFTEVNSSANSYPTSYTVSGDKKTVTVSATQQVTTGVTILGINVIGTLSFSAAPNGLPINVIVIGK